MPGKQTYHLWFPELYENKGGIQAYSQMFFSTLKKHSLNSELTLFIKNDRKTNIQGSTTVSTLSFGHFSPPIRTPAFALSAFLAAARHKPKAIICGHIHFSPLARLLKRFFGIPYWIICYGAESWGVTNNAQQKALREADRIISISEYTKDILLEEQELEESRISLLPCTFEEQRFSIGEKSKSLLSRFRLSEDQPILLTVNRLEAQEIHKSYDVILEALPKLLADFPNLKYIIVGRGSDQGRIEQLIAEKKLKEHVILTGFVPDEELTAFYQLCDLFVMPSKLEGFGIVFLEAMACGKPTLGGKYDGAQDALCHGKLGVLVDPDDQQEVISTIRNILRKEYPLPILYNPTELREQTLKRFSLSAFEANLTKLVDSHL